MRFFLCVSVLASLVLVKSESSSLRTELESKFKPGKGKKRPPEQPPSGPPSEWLWPERPGAPVKLKPAPGMPAPVFRSQP